MREIGCRASKRLASREWLDAPHDRSEDDFDQGWLHYLTLYGLIGQVARGLRALECLGCADLDGARELKATQEDLDALVDQVGGQLIRD